MKDDRPRPLNYETPRRDAAGDRRNAAYERNGWIGLAVTLAVCAAAAFVKFSCRRSW